MTPQQIPAQIKAYMMLVAGTPDLQKAVRMWCEAAGEDTPRWRNGKAAPRWMFHVEHPNELVPVVANQSGRLPGGWKACEDQGTILRLLIPMLEGRAVALAERKRNQ